MFMYMIIYFTTQPIDLPVITCLNTTWNLQDPSNEAAYSKWMFGKCNSPPSYLWEDIFPGKHFSQECCMDKKHAILKCDFSGQTTTNWIGGSLKIQDHRFCDVFFRKIKIRLNIQGINAFPQITKLHDNSFILE